MFEDRFMLSLSYCMPDMHQVIMTSSDEISRDVQIAQSTNQKRRLIKPNLAHVNIEFTSSIELPKNVQIH